MASLKEVIEKVKGIDFPKLLAIVDLFGGRENLDLCLAGRKRMIFEDVVRKFFDHTGRCIPAHLDISIPVSDENKSNAVYLPKINYSLIYDRAMYLFPRWTKFACSARLEDEAGALKEKYAKHELISNFFERARPIVLPKIDARSDYGNVMQKIIVPVVFEAYHNIFPERNLCNNCKKELSRGVKILPGTGHEELLELMAKKSVVAWYSPNPFQEFSAEAQWQAMKILRQYGFALAGGIDTGMALTIYTHAMLRSYYTPSYACNAVMFKTVKTSFCFDAYDLQLSFGISRITDYIKSSGGLVLFR